MPFPVKTKALEMDARNRTSGPVAPTETLSLCAVDRRSRNVGGVGATGGRIVGRFISP